MVLEPKGEVMTSGVSMSADTPRINWVKKNRKPVKKCKTKKKGKKR